MSDETMRNHLTSLLRSIPALTGEASPVDEGALPDDPHELFHRWLADAVEARVPEPRSVTLSTVDAQGTPDARVLVLREVSARGWGFASTASSRKGAQLAVNPAAALSFWWQPQMRAVRLRGPVVQASPEESLADLRSRSPAAQREVQASDWTLWHLQPERIEFWQGSADRRHLRWVYHRTEQQWSVRREDS